MLTNDGIRVTGHPLLSVVCLLSSPTGSHGVESKPSLCYSVLRSNSTTSMHRTVCLRPYNASAHLEAEIRKDDSLSVHDPTLGYNTIARNATTWSGKTF